MLQMNIYIPEHQHSRYAFLRTVVKDTTNENHSSTRGEMVFLDSDGPVANNVATATLNGGNPVNDCKWHMVTVTMQPDAWLDDWLPLYLDGVAVGELRRGSYKVKADNTRQGRQSELA